MALTLAQLTILQTFIVNDGTLNAIPNTPDGNFEIATALNAPSSPAFLVWRTAIPAAELIQAMVWTEYIGRSNAERDAWRFLTNQGTINAADTNVRQGISDMFSGPTGQSTRENLLALGKRTATRAEALFATGTGSDASPGMLTFEGNLTYQDVSAARTLP